MEQRELASPSFSTLPSGTYASSGGSLTELRQFGCSAIELFFGTMRDVIFGAGYINPDNGDGARLEEMDLNAHLDSRSEGKEWTDLFIHCCPMDDAWIRMKEQFEGALAAKEVEKIDGLLHEMIIGVADSLGMARSWRCNRQPKDGAKRQRWWNRECQRSKDELWRARQAGIWGTSYTTR